jgi:diadenosine tetraphosphate (Ap4A) HIT family hydrolase
VKGDAMTQYCPFCDEAADADQSIKSRIILQKEGFNLHPTLGCFREGYCLYTPVKHYKSFAQLNKEQLAKLEKDLSYIRQVITDEYPPHTIIAEHGPGLNGDCGASCCDHAHLHLIPVDNPKSVFLNFYSCGGAPVILASFENLSNLKNKPYVYLSCISGQHLVWQNIECFGRQFVRRVCASLQGIGHLYNWRLFPFYEQMRLTRDRLQERFMCHTERFSEKPFSSSQLSV